VQRNFERAGNLKEVDAAFPVSELGDFGGEGYPAPIDDVLVPAGLHKGDPSRVAIGYRGVVLTFGHGSSSSNETSWGAYGPHWTTRHARATSSRSLPSGL
jgi:hypothetical protein